MSRPSRTKTSMSEHVNNRTCALCFVDFEPEDEVRTIHPEKGLVFPSSHIWPDGQDDLGRRIPNNCVERHGHEPHIHEKCIPAWEDKLNVETPETREEAAEKAGITGFFMGIPGVREMIELFDDDYDAEYDYDEVWNPCPEGCSHDLDQHWEITPQVMKCRKCDCAF